MTTAIPSRPGVIDRLASTSHVWVAAGSVLLVVPMIVPIAPCLTSPSTRLAYKRLTERVAPSLVVLSYSEIAPGLRVESIGQVSTTAEVLEPVGAPA